MGKGMLFVISAPSGAGKSTLIDRIRLVFPDMLYSISCTTRARRGAERDGVDYYFLDRDRFLGMIKNGEFLEWKEVHGNLYGTPTEPVKRALGANLRMILDIDVQGARDVFSKIPESVGIFIAAPDMKTLEERLRRRAADSEESIRVRLKNAEREMTFANIFDYLIVNDDLDRAVAELTGVIEKESE